MAFGNRFLPTADTGPVELRYIGPGTYNAADCSNLKTYHASTGDTVVVSHREMVRLMNDFPGFWMDATLQLDTAVHEDPLKVQYEADEDAVEVPHKVVLNKDGSVRRKPGRKPRLRPDE